MEQTGRASGMQGKRHRTWHVALLCLVAFVLALTAPSAAALDDDASPPTDEQLTASLVPAAPALKLVPTLRTAPADEASTIVPPAPASPPHLLTLGPGDAVTIQVYGRPEMNTTTYVADDGTVAMPLAGTVTVGGLSPAQAAERVADALRGDYVVDPHVTVTLAQFRSQQVSVLGEVRTPGRYAVESRITPFDLLAQAGGLTENGADVVVLMRPQADGSVQRYRIDLRDLGREDATAPTHLLVQGGDSLFVPRAEQFYIYGEVQAPNMYRLEPGMTVIQAISRGGGITPRGSDRRIEIQRAAADGAPVTLSVRPTDPVQANDVIRVKERIF